MKYIEKTPHSNQAIRVKQLGLPGLRRWFPMPWQILLVCGFYCLMAYWNPACATPPKKFVFGTGAEEHSFTGQWERLIYTEAFKRLEVPFEIIVAPLKRIEMMLDRGQLDGETIRGPAYAELHPQLIAVELPSIPVFYAIYALKPVAGLSSLEDLRSGKFRGAYRRGVVFCQNALTPLLAAHQLSIVTTVKQGMDMLKVAHADFFCDVNLGVLNYQHEPQQVHAEPPQKLFDISQVVRNNAYLHPRHAAFAPALAATLKQMDKEGLIEKYRLQAIQQLRR